MTFATRLCSRRASVSTSNECINYTTILGKEKDIFKVICIHSLRFRSSFGGGGADTSLAEEDSHDVSVDSAALEPQVDIDEEQEEEQRCKICCAKFDDMGELREHFKEVHEIDLDTFNDNSEENEIQIEDTDTKEEKVEVKGFPCDQCDATYDRKDSLRRHKRNKH